MYEFTTCAYPKSRRGGSRDGQEFEEAGNCPHWGMAMKRRSFAVMP